MLERMVTESVKWNEKGWSLNLSNGMKKIVAESVKWNEKGWSLSLSKGMEKASCFISLALRPARV